MENRLGTRVHKDGLLHFCPTDLDNYIYTNNLFQMPIDRLLSTLFVYTLRCAYTLDCVLSTLFAYALRHSLFTIDRVP